MDEFVLNIIQDDGRIRMNDSIPWNLFNHELKSASSEIQSCHIMHDLRDIAACSITWALHSRVRKNGKNSKSAEFDN